ncbi:MAG TPA: type II toxin-antitoxin system VapC family toxin [Acidobacteriota bacterium]|nr:type II toxin-antitoxin system VapC family toxin [Acidobacteriota bacterium]
MEIARVLLDTSAYPAFSRGHAGLKEALQEAEEIFINVVVLGELLSGFRIGSHRKKNEKELRVFLASPRVNLLQMDDQTADRYALILTFLWEQGTSIPTNDLWIAASAAQHGLRLLTTDRHYERVPHIAVDYFEP